MKTLCPLILGCLLLTATGLGCRQSSSSPDKGPAPLTWQEENQPSVASDTDGDSTIEEYGLENEVAARLAARIKPKPRQVSSTKVLIDKYKNNIPRMERTVVEYDDGTTINHGKYMEWYENGQRYCEGTYTQGVRTGHWTFWYETGVPAKAGDYKNGKPDGLWIYWSPERTKNREETYREGVRQGRWLFYDMEGRKIRQEEYVDGKRQGDWIDWYPSGQKAAHARFLHGELHGTQSMWYANGQQAQSVEFKGGRRNGLAISWNERGEKTSELTYNNDELVKPIP